MVAGGEEMNPHFPCAVNGLLRYFITDKGIDAKTFRAVDKALATAGTPAHAADMRWRIITTIQHATTRTVLDALLQCSASQWLVKLAMRRQSGCTWTIHPDA